MKVFYRLCDSLRGNILKKLTVFCESSNRASDKYIEGAKKLGKELVKRNITLVYGGSSVRSYCRSVLKIGVMPSFSDNREIDHKKIVRAVHRRIDA